MAKIKEKIELLLEDLDVETIEQADEKIDLFRQMNETDDLDRIAWCLNSIADWIHFRVDSCRVSDYDRQANLSRIRVYTYLWQDKKYEVCIEDDYIWYDHWVECMVEDVIAFEKEADDLVLYDKTIWNGEKN